MKKAACLALLLLTSCRSDSIELSYRYSEGSVLEYRMTADARARWDIGEASSGSYRVVFDVTEEVRSADGEGTIVAVRMNPVQVEEDGLLSPGSQPRSFALRLGPNGEKLDVLEVDGVPASALDDDELALIGTYRPPLPLEAVGLGDSWDANQRLDLGSVFQQVATTGALEALYRDSSGEPVGVLSYAGEGPLNQTLSLPQGQASLTGTAQIDIDAELLLEEGYLKKASSTTRGVFEARVIPEGREAPVVGSLELALDLDLRLAER